MNPDFARKELNKLSEMAREHKDAFFGCYFSRDDDVFVGQNVGMMPVDAVIVIDKMIGLFDLDRAALAHHIAPAVVLPFKGKNGG